jgi:hypothetical protein
MTFVNVEERTVFIYIIKYTFWFTRKNVNTLERKILTPNIWIRSLIVQCCYIMMINDDLWSFYLNLIGYICHCYLIIKIIALGVYQNKIVPHIKLWAIKFYVNSKMFSLYFYRVENTEVLQAKFYRYLHNKTITMGSRKCKNYFYDIGKHTFLIELIDCCIEDL